MKEIIIHDAAKDIIIYRKIKSIIANLGFGPDTNIYIKDNDLKLVVYNKNNIDSIKKVLIENNIRSTYVEIGD